MQCIVFGIDGQQLRAGCFRCAGHQLAGHDQSLFVGQRHALATLERA